MERLLPSTRVVPAARSWCCVGRADWLRGRAGRRRSPCNFQQSRPFATNSRMLTVRVTGTLLETRQDLIRAKDFGDQLCKPLHWTSDMDPARRGKWAVLLRDVPKCATARGPALTDWTLARRNVRSKSAFIHSCFGYFVTYILYMSKLHVTHAFHVISLQLVLVVYVLLPSTCRSLSPALTFVPLILSTRRPYDHIRTHLRKQCIGSSRPHGAPGREIPLCS